MPLKKLVYISGPMSNMKDNNRPLFNRIAKLLRKRGYKVINPAELDKVSLHRTWEGFLRRDISFLVKCTDIATLPNWKKSRGAKLEIYVGKALSMPIHTYQWFLRRTHGRADTNNRSKKKMMANRDGNC